MIRDINSGNLIDITAELLSKYTRVKNIKDDIYLYFNKSDLFENNKGEVLIRLRIEIQTKQIRDLLNSISSK